MTSEDTIIAQCREVLARASERRVEEPDANPVRDLAFQLSRRLESGELDAEDVARSAKRVCDAAFRRRAARLGAYAGASDLGSVLEKLAGGDADALRAGCVRPRAGVVFTAHPTFALSRSMRGALAALADNPSDIEASKTLDRMAHVPDTDITIGAEHADTQAAIANAQEALRQAHRSVLRTLRTLDPEGWRDFTPRLASIASWVGYDFDGRSDIHWSDVLRFRLSEKGMQLRRYEAAARELREAFRTDLLDEFLTTVGAAASLTEEQVALFTNIAGDPDTTVTAANKLTEAAGGRLVSAAPLKAMVDHAVAKAREEPLVEALWLLRADIASFGLGTSEIHLRVNAEQVSNAVRSEFDVDPDVGGFGRVAMARAAEHVRGAEAVKINFAAIFLEQATARRQMMLAAQIRKHIDADAPIRFLIAETESPVTVLAAIALAKHYGVGDGLDISPLFETPEALEAGGRLMAQLLEERAYLDHVTARGRIAIQLGYSDSGRYMGQLAAGFAAERLQILLARALRDRMIRGLEVVIFNTHGESLGRGAHPDGMADRLRYVLTLSSRARFAKQGAWLTHETSFQGGDGLAHFATLPLAHRSLNAIIADALTTDEPPEADLFYDDISFSWDFYRSLKTWHETLRDHPDHGAVLSALGRNMLVKTGSRPTRRAGRMRPVDPGPRSLRAIPHNAILQQLGAPANVACGVGHAADIDADRFVDLAKESERAHRALTMVAAARQLTSLSVLRAYASLFDPTFWMARAFNGGEKGVEKPAAKLADRLKAQRRMGAYSRLANLFTADLAHFDQLAERAPALAAACRSRSEERADLELLHGMRVALLMRACLLAAGLPAFSDRFDVTRDDLVDLVLDADIEEATKLLDDIFPVRGSSAESFAALEEQADQSWAMAEHDYAKLHESTVAPLRRLLRIVREIGVGVSHAYNAYG